MILTDIGPAFLGGMAIGAAALILMAGIGRIAGISGILGEILGEILPRRHGHDADDDRLWRLAFVIGLGAGAGIADRASGNPAPIFDLGWPSLVLAGLLVGLGTGLGKGCTSGHGICGLARLSARSLVATLIFMAVAMIVVFLRRHVFGA